MARPEIVELARRAMKGDRAAFNELCEEKLRQMLFTARSVLKNQEDAEDAVQETILRMCKYFNQLKVAEAIDVWLYRILMSRCSLILSKRNKEIGHVDIDDEAIHVADDDEDFIPEKYVEDRELSRQLYDIILSLSPAKREAILLYYYDGLSHKEIAAIKGVTEKSISSLIAKARAQIRVHLENPEDGNPLYGLVLTAPMLSQILEGQAVLHIPDAVIMAFSIKYASALSVVKLSTAKSMAVGKVVSAIAACVVISGGIYFAQEYYQTVESDPSSTVVTDYGVDANVKQIKFSGGKCECGHQNPTAATIEGDARTLAERKVIWRIRSEASDETLLTGEGSGLSAEFADLKAAYGTGRYRLIFDLEDEGHSIVTMERDFELL